MILSSTTNALCSTPELAAQYFSIFKDAGFDAVDFSFSACFISTGGNFYRKPYTKSELFELDDKEFFEHFDKIKSEADKCGIAFGQCHAPYPSYRVGATDDLNEYIVKVIKRSIAAAGRMGCPYIVIHPITFPLDHPAEEADIFKANVKFYSQLIDDLKKANVVCCLENMWLKHKNKIMASSCNNYSEVNKYIKTLNKKAGGEYFGFCLDTGHAVLTSENIRFAIKTLGKNLKVLHLHEVDGVSDNHTIPYTLGNTVNWDDIMSALKMYGYSGTLNFEASNSWLYFPEELWPDAIRLLGAVGKYFCKKYFEE